MSEQDLLPWGLTRMAPFSVEAPEPAPRIVLDADTQTARWLGSEEAELPAWDRHKRSQTSRETSTRTSLDGTSDQGNDQEGDSD